MLPPDIHPDSRCRLPLAKRDDFDDEGKKIFDMKVDYAVNQIKRFLASQMKEAVYDTVAADVTAGDAVFHATGRTLKFDGFLRVLEAQKTEEAAEAARLMSQGLGSLERGETTAAIAATIPAAMRARIFQGCRRPRMQGITAHRSTGACATRANVRN